MREKACFGKTTRPPTPECPCAHGAALRRWDEILIALMFAFEFDEAVIPTGRAVGIIATHLRTAFVNRATTIVLIEEHTHRLIDVVFAMTQHANRFAFVLDCFGELLARFVDGDAMMLRQPHNVTRLRFDVVVTATVPRTLTTVVANFAAHKPLKIVDFSMLVKMWA
jgi:hypothetical protein